MVEFVKELKGLALFSLVFLLTFVKGDVGVPMVQCYVCSWQKPSTNLSLLDTCTHYNFRPEYASTVNCTTGGCEAVSYRHSKNEDIVHFKRNCLNLNSRHGKTLEDNCYVPQEKAEHISVCECHSNLCNSATSYTFDYHNFLYLIGLPLLVISGHLGHCYD